MRVTRRTGETAMSRVVGAAIGAMVAVLAFVILGLAVDIAVGKLQGGELLLSISMVAGVSAVLFTTYLQNSILKVFSRRLFFWLTFPVCLAISGLVVISLYKGDISGKAFYFVYILIVLVNLVRLYREQRPRSIAAATQMSVTAKLPAQAEALPEITTATAAITAGLLPTLPKLSDEDLQTQVELARARGYALVPVVNVIKYANQPEGPDLAISLGRVLELLDEYDHTARTAKIAASKDRTYFHFVRLEDDYATDEMLTWVYLSGGWHLRRQVQHLA